MHWGAYDLLIILLSYTLDLANSMPVEEHGNKIKEVLDVSHVRPTIIWLDYHFPITYPTYMR